MSKSAIIVAFQSLDLELIKVLIQDSTFQNANRVKFLEFLDSAFELFINNGDSELIAEKGKCLGCKLGCEGYAFVGNNSSNYINLIFDEIDNEIVDFCHCNNFKFYDDTLELSEDLNFCFEDNSILATLFSDYDNYDDNYDDNNDEYLWYLEKDDKSLNLIYKDNFSDTFDKCKEVLNELYQYKNEIIDSSIYAPWIQKFQYVYDDIDSKFLKKLRISEFVLVFDTLKSLSKVLYNTYSVEKAMQIFESQTLKDEDFLIKWCCRFEVIYGNLNAFFNSDLWVLHDFEKPYFVVEELFVSASEFKILIRFYKIFEGYYSTLLENYTTFSKSDIEKFQEENHEMYKYVQSLSYHINMRG